MKYRTIKRLLEEMSEKYPMEGRDQIIARVRRDLEADGNEWTSDLDLRCKIAYRLI